MSVRVERGGAFVKGDDTQDQGIYFVYNDGYKVLTVPAAHATLPRKDIVYYRVKDGTEGVAGDTAALEYLAGTAAGSPSEPALPTTAIKLGVIDVPANDTAITNSQITDSRIVTSSPYALVPVVKTADEPVVSSIAMQDDNQLRFPVGANQRWRVEFVVRWKQAAAAGGGINFNIGLPAGSSLLMFWSGSMDGLAPNGGFPESTGEIGVASIGSTGNWWTTINAIFLTGATPGEAILRWAQNTSDADATSVLAGSFVVPERLA